MRKSIVVLLTFGLVVGALAVPADAGKKKKKKPKRIERTIEVRYENPAFGSPNAGGACFGCPSFATAKNEVFMSIEVTDDVNPGAGSRFSWDTDGDGRNDTGFYVCGKTDEAVAIPGGVEITAFPYPVGTPDCPAAGAFSGTIKATFSNLP